MEKIKVDILERPKQREALSGNRTEVSKLVCDKTKSKCKRIRHRYIVSEYSTVMSRRVFPIGHYINYPKEILKEFDNNWLGFILCKIVPPK